LARAVDEIETLVDGSIIGHAIGAPIAEDFSGVFDLRAIDFQKLSAAFRNGQKRCSSSGLRSNSSSAT
jgi:hypothetical protein